MEIPEKVPQKKQVTMYDVDLRRLAQQSYAKVSSEIDLLKKLQLLLFALQQLVKIEEKESADHSNISNYSKEFYDIVFEYNNSSKQTEVEKFLKSMQSYIEVLNYYLGENPTENIIKEYHQGVIGMAVFVKSDLVENSLNEFSLYHKELQELTTKLYYKDNKNIFKKKLNEFVAKLCLTITRKLSLLIKPPLPPKINRIPIIGEAISRVIESVYKHNYEFLDENNQQLLEKAIQFLWGQVIFQIQAVQPQQSVEYQLSEYSFSDTEQREVAKEFYQRSLNQPDLLKKLQLLVFALGAIAKIKEKTEGDDDELVSYSTTFQELAKSYLSSASKQDASIVKNVLSFVDDVFRIIQNYPTEYATKILSIKTCHQDLMHLKFAHKSLEELLLITQVNKNEIVQIISHYHVAARLITNLTDENRAIQVAKINEITEALFSKIIASLSSLSNYTSTLQSRPNGTIIQEIVNFFKQNNQILNNKNAQHLIQLEKHVELLKATTIMEVEDNNLASTESVSIVENDKPKLTESIDESFRMFKNTLSDFNETDKQVDLTQKSIFEQFIEQLTKYIEVINANKTKYTINEYQKVIEYTNEVVNFSRWLFMDGEILKKCAILYRQLFMLMAESAGSNLFDITRTLSIMCLAYWKMITSKFGLYLLNELELLFKAIFSTTFKTVNSTENLIETLKISCLSLTTEQQNLFDSMCIELLEALGMFDKIISFMCSNKIKSFPRDILPAVHRVVIPFVDRLFYLGAHLENWPQIDSLSETFQKISNIVKKSFSKEHNLEVLVKKALELEHIRLNYFYKKGNIGMAVYIFVQFIRNEEFDDTFFLNLEKYLNICALFFKEDFSYISRNSAIEGLLAILKELSILEDKPNVILLINCYGELFHHFKKENRTVEAEIFYSSLTNIVKKVPNEQNIKVANEAAESLYGLNISALNLEPYLTNKITQNLTESKDVLTKTNLSNISLQQGQWQEMETVTGIWYGLVIAEAELEIPAMQRQDCLISRKIFIDELAKIFKDKNLEDIVEVIVVENTLFLRPSEAFLNQLSNKALNLRINFLTALKEKMRPKDEANIKFNPEKKPHRKGDFSQPLLNERKSKRSSSGKSAKPPKPTFGKESKKEKSVAKKSDIPKKVQQLPKPPEYSNPRVAEFLANPPRIVTTTKKVRKTTTPSQTSTPVSSSTTHILTTLSAPVSAPDIRHETQEATVLIKEKEAAPISQPEDPFLKAATHFRQQLEADIVNASDAKADLDIAIQKLNLQIDMTQFILALYTYTCKQPKTTQYENYRKSWEGDRRSLAHCDAELAGFQIMAKLITEKFPFTITELPEDLIDFNRQLEELIHRDFHYDYGTSEGCITVIGKQFMLMQSIIKPFSAEDPKILLRNFSTGADQHTSQFSIEVFALYKERYTAMIGCLIKLGEAYARLLECCQNDKQEIIWETVHTQLLTLNPLNLKKFKEFLSNCKNSFRNPACHESDPNISATGLLFDPDQVINAYFDSLTFVIQSGDIAVNQQEADEQKITEKDGKDEESNRLAWT